MNIETPVEKPAATPVVDDPLWREIESTPWDDEGNSGRFLAAAAALHRTTEAEIRRTLREGLLPFVYLGIKHGNVAASPAVGALIDDLRDLGGRAVNALLDRVKEVIPEDDRQGRESYEATLRLLEQEFGANANKEIWIAPDLYSGCTSTCKYQSQYQPSRSEQFIL